MAEGKAENSMNWWHTTVLNFSDKTGDGTPKNLKRQIRYYIKSFTNISFNHNLSYNSLLCIYKLLKD